VDKFNPIPEYQVERLDFFGIAFALAEKRWLCNTKLYMFMNTLKSFSLFSCHIVMLLCMFFQTCRDDVTKLSKGNLEYYIGWGEERERDSESNRDRK